MPPMYSIETQQATDKNDNQRRERRCNTADTQS